MGLNPGPILHKPRATGEYPLPECQFEFLLVPLMLPAEFEQLD